MKVIAVQCGINKVMYMGIENDTFTRLYKTKSEAERGKKITFIPKLRTQGGVTLWL